MKFSIIIPTCNRSGSIGKTLESLSNSSFSKNDFEVLIVDNSNLKDEAISTKRVVDGFSKFIGVKYFYTKKGGPSPARNLGVRKSKYNHLIFIDDDIVIKHDIIENYRRAWKDNPKAHMLGGKVQPNLGFPTPKFVNKEFRWVYALNDLGNKRLKLSYPQVLFSSNMSLRLRDSERSKNLFNENLGRRYFGVLCLFGEDVELCYRFFEEGKKVLYLPQLKVINKVDITRKSLFYYWKRIIQGGVERYLIDTILSKKYFSCKKYRGFNDIKSRLKIFIKNILFSQSRNAALFEHLVYFVSYHVLGRIFWAYINIQNSI